MKNLFLLMLGTACSLGTYAQNLGPNVTGNIETTFQYLNEDSLIGAAQPQEKGVLNSYINLNYSLRNFRAGARFESYLPHILGYPDRYSGNGIGYKYVGYYGEKVDFTAGNFYEQFGTGLIFRSYEARGLGFDNAMQGLSVKFRPAKGVEMKAVYGNMRYELNDGKLINSDGLVRGIDGAVDFNSLISSFEDSKLKITAGGSFVSKFQSINHPVYNIPKNVGSYGGRVDLGYGNFYLTGEHIIKENDPSLDNGYIYNNGHATLITGGYSQKGLGIVLMAKSVDNMSYRADPNATLTDLNINFLPALTKAHTYNLAASLYPYGSILTGEMAFQGDIYYKIPKKTTLGGKYGTTIKVNMAVAYVPERDYTGLTETDSLSRIAYRTGVFKMSDSLLHRDFNVEIKRKINKNFKVTAKYFNFSFNNKANKVTDEVIKGYIDTHIGVLDMQYKISKKHSVRTELQGLFTQKDRGNWATVLVEYNISPHWFFAVMDQYNYGHPREESRIHYLIGSTGYSFGASRFMMTYGKQRAGIFCIGGVCRPVPASNGLTFTFTSSF